MSRCRARSSWPRSRAPTPSCTSTRRSASSSPSSPACTSSPSARRSRCISTRTRSTCSTPPATCSSRRPRAREHEMARIDLDLAHAYMREPEERRRLRAAAARDELRRRRRLRAARPVGLRQDDAAQHRLGPGQAVARHGQVRRRRRHRANAAAAEHRPGVPVPGHLRHDDGGREPRLPAAQPRRRGRAHRAGASARSPRCSS